MLHLLERLLYTLAFVSVLAINAGCGLSVSLWGSSSKHSASSGNTGGTGGSVALQEFYQSFGTPSGLVLMAGATSDSDNNIYAAGAATGGVLGDSAIGSVDAVIAKYAPDGTYLWHKAIGSSGSSTLVNRLYYKNGSLYASGYTIGGVFEGQTAVGNSDMFVAKLNIDTGAVIWLKMFGQPSTQMATAELVVDSSENVYVTGYGNMSFDSYTVLGNMPSFVMKLDSSGNRLWTSYLDENGMFFQASGIGLDNNGNVYIGGSAIGASFDGQAAVGNLDGFIAKFDSNGNKLWAKRTGSASNRLAIYDIEVDASGNSYIGGTTIADINGQTMIGNSDQFVEKYNSSGVRQWTKIYGVANASTQVSAIHLDSSGRVLIGGGTDANTTDTTGWSVKRLNSSNGALVDEFSSSAATALIMDFQVTSDGWLKAVGVTKSSLEGQPLTGVLDAFVLVKKIN